MPLAERKESTEGVLLSASTRTLVEEGLGYLDMAGHSYLRIALQRFCEQRLRFFTITWGCAID